MRGFANIRFSKIVDPVSGALQAAKKVRPVERSTRTAADARAGLWFLRVGQGRTGGPARTRASAPHAEISREPGSN